MSLTRELGLFLLIAILGVLFGISIKNKLITIFSLASLTLSILFILFLVFILIPSM